MLIDETIVKEFAKLLLEISKETAIKAHNYILNHSKIYGYGKYPEKKEIFPKDKPEYLDLYEKIPYLIYDIPRYYERDYPEGMINYGGIFYNYTGDFLDCTSLEQFKVLIEYVNSQSELQKLIVQESNDLQYKLKRIVVDIVERYMFATKATANVPQNLENVL